MRYVKYWGGPRPQLRPQSAPWTDAHLAHRVWLIMLHFTPDHKRQSLFMNGANGSPQVERTVCLTGHKQWGP